MKKLLPTLSALLVSGVAFIIGKGISEEYLSSLKRTGGLITANTILEIQCMPFVFAISGFYIVYKLHDKD